MNKLIILIISIIYLIGSIAADPILLYVKEQKTNTYGSDYCNVIVNVLIEYPRQLTISGDANGYPILVNGSTTLYEVSQRVSVGSTSMKLVAYDYTLPTQPSFVFPNFVTVTCEAVPTNVAADDFQDKWAQMGGLLSSIVWMKFLNISNLEKSVPYDSFICTVPAPFVCFMSEFLNGEKVNTFIVQVAILQKNTAPFAPFDVVISTKQGKHLHTSKFDGLKEPSNPPVSIKNVQVYPQSGSTVRKGEMTNEIMYIVNIENKNTIASITGPSDYLSSYVLVPVLGSVSNATYIGLSYINQYENSNTHIQIVDSQGLKRIGGDNIININSTSKYSLEYTSIQSSFDSQLIAGSNILNIDIIGASYNPEFQVLYSFFDFHITNFGYPYGISSGTLRNHKKSFTNAVTNHFNGPVNTYTGGSISFTTAGNTNTSVPDTKSPLITKVEMYNIGFEKVLIRVYATDDISGISSVTINGVNIVKSMDLVWGTPLNGIYEAFFKVEAYLYSSPKPSISISDKAKNSATINSNNAILDTNLNQVPDYPMIQYMKTNGLSPFNFTGFEFKKNNIDVSNQPINNTLCFNFVGSNKKMVPRFYLISRVIDGTFLGKEPTYGKWDETQNMFCIEFTIPARIFTGEMLYAILITPYVYDSYYLAATVGDKARLMVTSTYGDQMPPVVSELQPFPSAIASITSNTFVGWNLRIDDAPNGLLDATFNVTSDLDNQPYQFKFTPTNAITGDLKSGNYQIRIPISLANCRAQTFTIVSAFLQDTQGQSSETPSTMTINPFYKYFTSDNMKISVTCPMENSDNIAPVLTSLSSSVSSIDVGKFKEFRDVTFIFTTSDSGSGISSRHNPVVYFTSFSIDQISKVSTLISNVNGVATYTCTINIPYGFGSNEAVLISIYGIVDNQLNMNGYSTINLKSMGFPYYISTNYSYIPVLESTTPITSVESTLTIYGHKFGIDPTKVQLQVDYQNGQGFKNTAVSFFAGIVLITNSIIPTETPFYVRVIVDGVVSNPLLVVPTVLSTPCGYEISQSIVSSWNNSDGTTNFPFSQVTISIKNNGNKPITSFSFLMDSLSGMWGVDTVVYPIVDGVRYSLPSWHSTINPLDTYQFGYIIQSNKVGQLKQVQVTCGL